jgi:hypothetical protein
MSTGSPLRTPLNGAKKKKRGPLRSPVQAAAVVPVAAVVPAAIPARWSTELKKAFLDCLVREKDKGLFTDSGLKSSSWKCVVLDFNITTGMNYSVTQLQSQYALCKKNYGTFKTLLQQSGFGLDPETGRVTAPDKVWDEYLAAHPEALPFRTSTLKFMAELEAVFSDSVATGRFALSSVGHVGMGADRGRREETEEDEEGENDDSTIASDVAAPAKASPVRATAAKRAGVGSDVAAPAKASPVRAKAAKRAGGPPPLKKGKHSSVVEALQSATKASLVRVEQVTLALSQFDEDQRNGTLTALQKIKVKIIISKNAALYLQCDANDRLLLAAEWVK